ncbi:hypothetical protein [Nocardia sp. NPDC005366]|uniref:hypothetical protein n=1 Tax=Nocardia sp. NPDC005366 TaxID=3156878 RepID=UPI0033AF8184
MNLVVVIGVVLVVAGMLGILAVVLRGSVSTRDHLTVAEIQARLAGERPLAADDPRRTVSVVVRRHADS